MKNQISIYCDESCHLQNDNQKVMALGAIHCPTAKKDEIFQRIAELKIKYNLIPKNKKNPNEKRAYYEIKWNKISKSQLPFYRDVIDYFFDDNDISFRVLVVSDKSKIDYDKYGHTHDTFYYKMYFSMLKAILNPEFGHNIFIDIKDTRSTEKVHKLEEILRNEKYDYSKSIIRKVQQVRSHELELIQLADLLTGAVSYINRGLHESPAKNELIELIRHRSNYSLVKSTLLQEKKFNIFIWEPSLFTQTV